MKKRRTSTTGKVVKSLRKSKRLIILWKCGLNVHLFLHRARFSVRITQEVHKILDYEREKK